MVLRMTVICFFFKHRQYNNKWQQQQEVYNNKWQQQQETYPKKNANNLIEKNCPIHFSFERICHVRGYLYRSLLSLLTERESADD